MNTKKVLPRNVPGRDDFYMGLAFWIASKSKDPRTQCGALIVSKNNVPLGYGYNGPPARINDSDINWDRPAKYDFIIHAEENAITHSNGDLDMATIYVSAKPCSKCMLQIAASKIVRVVYFPYINPDQGSISTNEAMMQKTDEIARLSNVSLEEFKGNLNWMRDRAEWMKSIGVFD